MGLSDRLLLHRLRRRDRRAGQELIARYHAGLYGYLRHLGADPHQAEDLLQDTYARAWAKIGTLRNPASLRAWLYAIARNQFLQARRLRKPRTVDCDPLPDPPDPGPGPLQCLVESERDRSLVRALRQLEPSLCELVTLHYFQDLSLGEIGVVMELPVGTVKSRLSRALSLLRDHLKGEESDHAGSGTRKAPAGAR